MPKTITMPKLGESVTEGTIGKWLVRPGDQVKKYQPLAEVVTDKVNAEIPAEEAGTVLRLLVEEGATVPNGTAILDLEVAGAPAAAEPSAAVAPAPPAPAPAPAPAAPAPVPRPGAAPAVAAAAPGGAVTVLAPPRDGNGGVVARYSPAVLRLAQEHNVDLSRLKGSGEGGRITRKDVEAFIASGGAAATPAPPPTMPAPATPATAAPRQGVPTAEGDTAIPVTPVRRTIAARMLQSKQTAPHAWTMQQADVTGLVRLRESRKADFQQREGVVLTFLPFFVKACAEALKEHPMVNSVWGEDQIILKRHINISIAIALEDSLVVPVIRDADRLSIAGIAHAAHDLAERARAGRLTIDDVQGGTFTVNNTGALGSIASAPIINFPQAAIVAFEAIRKEPVVTADDAIAIRSVVNLCMSLDHRILDGLESSRFLTAIRRRLESYAPGGDI